MINHISMTAVLLDVDIEKSNVRYIEVQRNYKDNKGHYQKDVFPCMMWSKKDKGSFFVHKSGTVVAIDGRVEIEDNITYIIIECITYMFSTNTEVNLRSS